MDAAEGTIGHIVEMNQRLYLALRSSLAEQWMQVEYTMPQLKVLLFLHTDGPVRMTQLATALRISLPTATGIMDRLVERGVVLRESDPKDRRSVICCLSPEGKRQISELWEASFNQLRDLLRPLPPERLDVIAQGVQLMLEAAEQHNSNKAHVLS